MHGCSRKPSGENDCEAAIRVGGTWMTIGDYCMAMRKAIVKAGGNPEDYALGA